MARRSPPSPLALGLALVAVAAGSASASSRHLLDAGDGGWTSWAELSCVDNNGENLSVVRDVKNLKKCRHHCEGNDKCVAVTFNEKRGDCYLKSQCDYLQRRYNGDSSAGYDRPTPPPSNDPYQWEDKPGRTCMDDSGYAPNVATLRNVWSLDDCKTQCESNNACNAVTWNARDYTCYLKRSCDRLERRRNGDDSAILTRSCEPPTKIYCPRGSSSSKCLQYCGYNVLGAPQQSQQQCGGVVYLCS